MAQQLHGVSAGMSCDPGKPVTGMNSSRTGSPVQQYLNQLYERLRPLRDGIVATYIPELAGAEPDGFAICVATMDGYVYEVGDSRRPFTIQSMSKPFVYGLALEDRGKPAVLQRIGVEPTGDAFNEISLERNTGRPFNPMINAGAIASSSLVLGIRPRIAGIGSSRCSPFTPDGNWS